MSEFVGRTGAQRVYSYPETQRRGDALTTFARNFATGPKVSQDATGGVQIQWNNIDVAPATPDEDVPITPRSTGVVLLQAIVLLTNETADPALVALGFQIDDVDVPVPIVGVGPIPANSAVEVPLLTEVTLTVGVTVNVQIFVNGEVSIAGDGSAINVQEVPVSTG